MNKWAVVGSWMIWKVGSGSKSRIKPSGPRTLPTSSDHIPYLMILNISPAYSYLPVHTLEQTLRSGCTRARRTPPATAERTCSNILWCSLKSCFVGSSNVLLEAVLWIRIGFLSDQDPGFWWPKIVKFYSWKKTIYFYQKRQFIYPLASMKDVQATGEAFSHKNTTSTT